MITDVDGFEYSSQDVPEGVVLGSTALSNKEKHIKYRSKCMRVVLIAFIIFIGVLCGVFYHMYNSVQIKYTLDLQDDNSRYTSKVNARRLDLCARNLQATDGDSRKNKDVSKCLSSVIGYAFSYNEITYTLPMSYDMLPIEFRGLDLDVVLHIDKLCPYGVKTIPVFRNNTCIGSVTFCNNTAVAARYTECTIVGVTFKSQASGVTCLGHYFGQSASTLKDIGSGVTVIKHDNSSNVSYSFMDTNLENKIVYTCDSKGIINEIAAYDYKGLLHNKNEFSAK